MSVSRPVLIYHGGKFRIAPWIVENMPTHRVYVELFGGAASVLMRKPRAAVEVYNDLDSRVVGLFRVLRDPVTAEALRAALERTPYSREEFEQSYAATDDAVEAARRLMVRSYMGVSSASATRESPVGFDNSASTDVANRWAGMAEAIPAFVERLRGVIIERGDYRKLISQYDSPDTLFYADPPYAATARGKTAGREYAHEFKRENHVELRFSLANIRGAAIVSHYRDRFYNELYATWERRERANRIDKGSKRIESIWLNGRARDAVAVRSLFPLD